MRPGTFSPLRLRLWLSLCLACVCLVCLRPTCPLGGVCLFVSSRHRAAGHKHVTSTDFVKPTCSPTKTDDVTS